MKKLLGIMVLGFLFSGNTNAGINEPGLSFLSTECKAGFDTEHYKIKKLENFFFNFYVCPYASNPEL